MQTPNKMHNSSDKAAIQSTPSSNENATSNYHPSSTYKNIKHA